MKVSTASFVGDGGLASGTPFGKKQGEFALMR
jgi:hypothetical protein